MSQTITSALEHNFQQNYDKLQTIVGKKPELGNMSSSLHHRDTGMNLLKTFGIIFIIVLLSLLIIKPARLVTYETDDGLTRTDVFALFQYSFIFSIIIIGVYKMP